MAEQEWFQSHTNLVSLAFWLDDQNFWSSPSDVIDFFEKPWHWPEEWARYCAEIDEQKAANG